MEKGCWRKSVSYTHLDVYKRQKQAIGGQMLMQMILAAVDKLNAEKGSIDSLNVFPVPDGDTGTNMSLTLNSAGRFIGKLTEEQVSVSEVAKQMAHGALMGARGNSGVILSQILGGFAAALTDKEAVDSASLAAGFAGGVESAYKACLLYTSRHNDP